MSGVLWVCSIIAHLERIFNAFSKNLSFRADFADPANAKAEFTQKNGLFKKITTVSPLTASEIFAIMKVQKETVLPDRAVRCLPPLPRSSAIELPRFGSNSSAPYLPYRGICALFSYTKIDKEVFL